MKRDYLLALAIILMINFLPTNSTADFGGSNVTITTLTAPTSSVEGNPITMTSDTTSGGSAVALGNTAMMQLTEKEVFGPTSDGSILQASDPVFQFTPSSTMTIYAVRIPIIDLVNKDQLPGNIMWEIYDDLASIPIIRGDIYKNEMDKMISEDGLLLMIGTFQTDPSDWSNGLSITAYNDYFIKFNPAVSLTFHFKVSTDSTSNLNFYDGATLQTLSPSMSIYTGIYLSRNNVVNGQVSKTITPSAGRYLLLASYGEGMVFQPSYDSVLLEVTSNSPPSITTQDLTGELGSSVDITAQVYDQGQPVSGAVIDYYLIIDNVYHNMGSATTTTGGVATLNYLISLDPATYQYQAEVTITSRRAISNSLLTVTNPQAHWSVLQATGIFATALNNYSITTISGYLLSSSSSAISGESVNIYKETQLLTTVVTDQNGYFSHTDNFLFPIGINTNAFEVKYVGTIWYVANSFIDANIQKGQLTINIPDVNQLYEDQPAIINGLISDQSGSSVNAWVVIERYDTNVWTELGQSLSTGGVFNYQLDIMDVGNYLFRAKILASANFFAAYQLFNVNIGQSQAFLSRETLPSLINIQYRDTATIAIRVKDSLGNSIQGVKVNLSRAADFSGNSYIYVDKQISDTSGWVYFDFTPDSYYYDYPYLKFPLRFTAIHNNYYFSQYLLDIKIVTTTLTINVTYSYPIIDSVGTISISTVDLQGFVGDLGTQLSVVVEGIAYIAILDSYGKASVGHLYSSVGGATIDVILNDGNEFPYYNTNVLTPINIAKGEYHFAALLTFATQGEIVDFNTTIYDHNDQPSSITLSLYYFDITWKKLGDFISNSSGIVVATDIINPMDLGPNNYTYEWRFNGNVKYNQTITSGTLRIRNTKTQILVTTPTSYSYGSIPSTRQGWLRLQINRFKRSISDQVVLVKIDNKTIPVLTDINGESYFELPEKLTPGWYDVFVEYSGSGSYLSSFNSTQVQVIGTDTILSWVIQPQNTYFGEILELAVIVQDEYSQILENMTIDLIIGSYQLSKPTNSSGIVYFSLELRHVNDTVTINLHFNAVEGYNPSDISISIDNSKRDLFGNINSIIEVYYSQILNLQLNVSSTNEEFVDGVRAELWWFNITLSDYQVVQEYITDNNGSVTSHVNLPWYDAGSNYLLKWVISHTDYIGTEISYSILITKMPVYASISSTNSTYLHNSDIMFTIVDSDNRSISDMEVELVYAPFTIEWSDIQLSNSIGKAYFVFPSPSSGLLTLSYTISESTGNYVILSRTLDIHVAKAEVDLQYEFIDNNTHIELIVDVIDTTGLSINTEIVLNIYNNGQWIELDRLSTSQGRIIFSITINADQMRFDLIVNDPNIVVYNKEVTLYKQDIEIEYFDQFMYSNGNLSFDANLRGNGSLNYYQINLSYLDGTWIDIGIFNSSNGVFNDSIPISISPGAYSLKMHFIEQSWYREKIMIVNLRVDLAVLTIEHNSTNFSVHVNNYMKISVSTQELINLTGIDISLAILINGTWVDIDQGLTENGDFIANFTVDHAIGDYDFRITTKETSSISSSILVFIAKLRKDISISMEQISPASYQQAGEIRVIVTDSYDQSLLVNILIKIYYGTDKTYLIQELTDINGEIIFEIPPLFNPGNVLISAESVDLGYYSFSNISLNYVVDAQPVKISYSIIDFGITNNKSVEIIISVNTTAITNGLIDWTILTSTSTVYLQGQIRLNDGSSNAIIINGDLVGSYSLLIRYNDPKGLFKSTSLTIDEIGFIPLDYPKIQVENVTILHQDNQLVIANVFDKLNNYPLQNIDVKLFVNNTDRGVFTTDESGNIYLLFGYLDPGYYDVILSVPSSMYFNNEYNHTFSIVVYKGNEDFSVLVNNYFYPSNTILVNITDKLYENSYYLVYISNIEYNYSIIFSHDMITIATKEPLLPKTYELRIIRVNAKFENYTVTVKFTIIPFEVDIIRTESIVNKTLFVNMTIIAPENAPNDLPYGISYTIRINDDYYTLENSSAIQINLDGAGMVYIDIQVYGYYNGSMQLSIPFDFTQTDDTLDVSSNTTTTSKQSSDSFIPVGSELLLLVGIGVLTIAYFIFNKNRQ